MHQSASAATTTRRPPASSAAPACCPMFHPQYFVNTLSPLPLLAPANGQQCLLGAQQTQISGPAAPLPLANSQRWNVDNVQVAPANGQPQQQQQQQQPPPQQQHHQQQQPQQQQPTTNPAGQATQTQRQDHSNYSTSISAPGLPLQWHHLLATSRHSASNCLTLAAALASASFPHFQQLQAQQQHHQQNAAAPSLNQQVSNTAASNPAQPNAANTTTNNNTNQVPILNFNSYNAAQPFLNLPTQAPLAAHLNLSSTTTTTNPQQQQQPSTNVALNSNANASTITAPPANPANQITHQNHRPLATNTTLNSVANQQQQNYRTASQPPQAQQQLGQIPNVRNALSDDALIPLFNEHFQAILLNQLFSNHQFAPQAPPLVQAAPANSTTRHVSPPPTAAPSNTTLPNPAVAPVQQAAPLVTQQQQPAVPSSELASEPAPSQPPSYQAQATNQPRSAPVGLSAPLNSYSTQAANNSNLYQQPSQNVGPVNPSQQAGINQQPTQSMTNQSQPQQQPQAQSIPPQMPFYSFPQMDTALALLSNPQVTTNLFSHVFNIYLQGGLRTNEPHHTHHHHHLPHHHHHHLHGLHHHHHHHHPNGQQNGQDVATPLDSLAINETKPRGLSRAEIDSFTPYIQMNEKDSGPCVICLSKFELKSKIRPLPCNHAFHAKCLDKWLRANRTCPICRRDALKTHGAKIKRI